MPRAVPLPRVRPGQPRRPRCLGRHLRARAAADPPPAPPGSGPAERQLAAGAHRAETVLECIVNLSEGADAALLGVLAATAGSALLDLHADPDHHRSVLTLAGPATEEAARAVARAAV